MQRRDTGGASHGHYRLHGWRQLWYGGIVRLPFAFYELAWLDCSVPFTRGHLGGLLRPAEARFAPPPGDRACGDRPAVRSAASPMPAQSVPLAHARGWMYHAW